MSAQTTYSYSTPIGQAGGIFDLYPHGISAFTNEANDGVMKYGMAAVASTTSGKVGKAVKTGAGTFVGVVNNRRTTENDMYGNVIIRKGATVGVMRWGRCYVLLDENAEPAVNGKVYFTSDGLFTNASSGNTEVAGIFLTTKQNGVGNQPVAVVHLYDAPQPAGN